MTDEDDDRRLPPGNPDGKGLTPVLSGLADARAPMAAVPAKPVERVATELFTSMFVLESEFSFKPVRGKAYYLYREQARFWLGLTPPSMMPETVGGRFIGTAVLRDDATWTLELADAVAADESFTTWLAEKRRVFDRRLGAAKTVDDVLPVYESRLSFHRRAAAFGVAHSLSRSMSAAGIRGLSYDEARGLLANDPPERDD